MSYMKEYVKYKKNARPDDYRDFVLYKSWCQNCSQHGTNHYDWKSYAQWKQYNYALDPNQLNGYAKWYYDTYSSNGYNDWVNYEKWYKKYQSSGKRYVEKYIKKYGNGNGNKQDNYHQNNGYNRNVRYHH